MFRLVRETPLKDDCTLGILRDDNDLAICCTLELPWLDNEPQISCIPTGKYKVVRRWSVKFRDHFHILDVPNRKFILIHSGNTVDDIRGCVLVGRTYGTLKGKRAVMNSRVTMERLLMDLPESFELEIV